MIPISQFERLDDLGYICVGYRPVKKGQVIAHAGVEKLDILGDHPHLVPEVSQRDPPDIYPLSVPIPADGHTALVRVVEAEDQACQGGLTRPGASQQTKSLAGLEVKRKVLDYDLILDNDLNLVVFVWGSLQGFRGCFP